MIRSLFEIEVSNGSVIGKEVTPSEELCNEVDVPVILQEPIVVQLSMFILIREYDEGVGDPF